LSPRLQTGLIAQWTIRWRRFLLRQPDQREKDEAQPRQEGETTPALALPCIPHVATHSGDVPPRVRIHHACSEKTKRHDNPTVWALQSQEVDVLRDIIVELALARDGKSLALVAWRA
jgi:hypothetical protein